MSVFSFLHRNVIFLSQILLYLFVFYPLNVTQISGKCNAVLAKFPIRNRILGFLFKKIRLVVF